MRGLNIRGPEGCGGMGGITDGLISVAVEEVEGTEASCVDWTGGGC